MIRHIALLFLALISLSNSAPTFTWGVYTNYIATWQPKDSPNPDIYCMNCSPLSYIAIAYYSGIEVANCACEYGSVWGYPNLIQGTMDYDLIGTSSGKFTNTPPVEIDCGVDGTVLAKKQGDNTYLYIDDPDQYVYGTMNAIAGTATYGSTNPIVAVSVGSRNWIIGTWSGGKAFVYNIGTNTWNAITTGTPPATIQASQIAMGSDGVFAYIPSSTLGGGAPIGCQLNSDLSGSTSNCKVMTGSSSFCRAIQVLDANNIVCFDNYNTLYYLNGGYTSNSGWQAITNLPAAPNTNCFADSTGNAKSCLQRINIGDSNASGNMVFTYQDSSLTWRYAVVPKQ